MMILWACAGVPLGVYNIVEGFNVALRIQPQILTTLSLLTWAQCYYYGKASAGSGSPQSLANGKLEMDRSASVRCSYPSCKCTWRH